MDRCSHISGFIYATAEGRDPHFYRAEGILRLRRFQPVLIYCRSGTSEEMSARVSAEFKPHKPKEYLQQVLERHPTICQLYDDYFEALEGSVPVFRYDFRTDHPRDLADRITQIWRDL